MAGSVSQVFEDDEYLLEEGARLPYRKFGSFVAARNSQEIIANQRRPTGWRKVKQIIGELFLGPIYIRAIFAFLVAVILGAVSYIRNPPERQDEIVDLGVYSLIYGAWIIFCAPMLLATINVRLVVQTLHIVARIFFAEMAVLAYAYYRGHNNILRRGFSLIPTLEANRPGTGLAWLGEAGYNLRLASLISCFVIAAICKGMELWAERTT